MPSSAWAVSAPFMSRLHGAEADEHRGDGDDDHLDERGKRLGLAVPEAVVVVGRRSSDTNAKQDDEAGDQIQRAVRQGAKHRHRMESAERRRI